MTDTHAAALTNATTFTFATRADSARGAMGSAATGPCRQRRRARAVFVAECSVRRHQCRKNARRHAIHGVAAGQGCSTRAAAAGVVNRRGAPWRGPGARDPNRGQWAAGVIEK